jgi:DNA polymerase-4
LVRTALTDHPDEATISLLGISVSHLTKQAECQLDLPLGGNDLRSAPARGAADGALDTIRERFGWKAIGYGSVVLDPSRSVPDEFRELAEHELL